MNTRPTQVQPYHAKRKSFLAFSKDKIQKKWGNVKKVQFFVILSICTGVLVFEVSECIKKYVARSTGTADKYVHTSATSFPVLTICPTYPYRLDRLNFHGIGTKTEIQFGSKFVSNDSSVSAFDFYYDVILTKEQVIRRVDVFADAEINGKNKFSLLPNESLCGEQLFQTKPYYYNGDCFALSMPQCLKASGVLEVVIEFHDKTDIFIHHEGQFLSPNSRSRVDVDKGKFMKIAINHEVVQMLSDKGTCVDSYTSVDDSFDGCMYSGLHEIMMSEVGCTVPWLPDQSKICVEEKDRTQAFSLYQKNRRNQHNICPNSCKFTNMYFGPPVTGQNNAEESQIAKGIFYFRRDIKTTTEYYLYSILSMLAEIGGYVGLLMGVSLFKVADINNSVVDWVIENKIAESRQGTNTDKQDNGISTVRY